VGHVSKEKKNLFFKTLKKMNFKQETDDLVVGSVVCFVIGCVCAMVAVLLKTTVRFQTK